MDVQNAIIVISILFVLWVFWRWWRLVNAISRRIVAHKVLESRGLEARAYHLPQAGDDKMLGAALKAFENTNYVVFDKHGKVVGRSLPTATVVASGRRKPRLQVVVDNTKAENDET